MIFRENTIKSKLITFVLSIWFTGGIFALSYSFSPIEKDYNINNQSKEFDPSKFISDHIADSHEFHILDWNGHSISLPLPIILYTKKGIVTFMASKFKHDESGRVVVSKRGQDFVRIRGNVFYRDKIKGVDHSELESLGGSLNFEYRPVNLSLTKNAFSMILSVVVLFVIFSIATKNYKKNNRAPKGVAGFVEPLIIFVKEEIAIPNIGREKYMKFMPYLLSVFFFIWVNNLIGLIPFFPFSANLTGNLAFTFTLALITFLITTFSGNKNYWRHIFTPHVPKWLYPLMIPVELIGMLTKPFALMIRLFANIAAGHIIILSLIALIFIFKTVAVAPLSAAFVIFMSTLELLVAALQAYVFTLLSALFIGQAVDEHH